MAGGANRPPGAPMRPYLPNELTVLNWDANRSDQAWMAFDAWSRASSPGPAFCYGYGCRTMLRDFHKPPVQRCAALSASLLALLAGSAMKALVALAYATVSSQTAR